MNMGKHDETEIELLKKSEASTFEEAIAATKFGKFNILLIFLSLPCASTTIFGTNTMSFVFPAAQCDLNLSLKDKGLLNAVTFSGMISSGFIWGYICDSFGRRKLLVIGYFLTASIVLMSSLSQSATFLITAKFLEGFIISGPHSALACYISEFHCAKYRARIQMVLGSSFGIGKICLSLLSALILPINVDITIFNHFRLHSWNFLLLAASIPPVCGCLIFFFLPESPKFLMTVGKNEEALNIMRMVYKFNTGKSAETFPINSLIDETRERKNFNGGKIRKNIISRGFSQFKPLFSPPLLRNVILVCFLQLLQMMSLLTIRLWLPQIFQAVSDYEFYHKNSTANLCEMLEIIRPRNRTKCVVNTNTQVYYNTLLTSTTSFLGYVIVGYLINILGKKRLIFCLGVISGLSGYSFYFAKSFGTTTAISSIFNGVGTITILVIVSVTVDLFPTTLRAMAVSMAMMCGRLGAMSGNIVFPFLLNLGCAPPFFTAGSALICVALLSMLLPNTDMKPLL